MIRWPLLPPLVLVGLTIAAEVIVFASSTGPLHLALGLWFILVAPGWAILRLLDLSLGIIELVAAAVGLSVSIVILLTTGLFFVPWWSVALAITLVLSMVVADRVGADGRRAYVYRESLGDDRYAMAAAMKLWSVISPLVLVELIVAAEVVLFASSAGPLRVGLGLWFILVAPGWAVLRLLDLSTDSLEMAAVAIGISVSIDILLALGLFYARWWSIEVAMTILLASVVAAIVADVAVVQRAPRRGGAPSAVRE